MPMHSQNSAVSFTVTIFLSGLHVTGSDFCSRTSVSQSVRRRLTNLQNFRDFSFVFCRHSQVFLWVAH